jgi:hypothetical protein
VNGYALGHFPRFTTRFCAALAGELLLFERLLAEADLFFAADGLRVEAVALVCVLTFSVLLNRKFSTFSQLWPSE